MYPHQPVLLKEATEQLAVGEGIYVDGTAGTGGHSEAVGRRLGHNGRLICLDRDPDALTVTRKRLAFLGNRVSIVQADYSDLFQVIRAQQTAQVNGVLLDLGMSSLQLDHSGRGFSFTRDEPLDMRMDPGQKTSARDLINQLPEAEIARILKIYGEERHAGRIAGAIAWARQTAPIETSRQLADLVTATTPHVRRHGTKHPATRTFQAIRIAVNEELQKLERFLARIVPLLAPGGRLVVISYHSLEDRRVKQAMMEWEKGCICPPDFPRCVCNNRPRMRRVHKKPIRAGASELDRNPRARSAVLRTAERIEQ